MKLTASGKKTLEPGIHLVTIKSITAVKGQTGQPASWPDPANDNKPTGAVKVLYMGKNGFGIEDNFWLAKTHLHKLESLFAAIGLTVGSKIDPEVDCKGKKLWLAVSKILVFNPGMAPALGPDGTQLYYGKAMKKFWAISKEMPKMEGNPLDSDGVASGDFLWHECEGKIFKPLPNNHEESGPFPKLSEGQIAAIESQRNTAAIHTGKTEFVVNYPLTESEVFKPAPVDQSEYSNTLSIQKEEPKNVEIIIANTDQHIEAGIKHFGNEELIIDQEELIIDQLESEGKTKEEIDHYINNLKISGWLPKNEPTKIVNPNPTQNPVKFGTTPTIETYSSNRPVGAHELRMKSRCEQCEALGMQWAGDINSYYLDGFVIHHNELVNDGENVFSGKISDIEIQMKRRVNDNMSTQWGAGIQQLANKYLTKNDAPTGFDESKEIVQADVDVVSDRIYTKPAFGVIASEKPDHIQQSEAYRELTKDTEIKPITKKPFGL